jgi:hypothetical protein
VARPIEVDAQRASTLSFGDAQIRGLLRVLVSSSSVANCMDSAACPTTSAAATSIFPADQRSRNAVLALDRRRLTVAVGTDEPKIGRSGLLIAPPVGTSPTDRDKLILAPVRLRTDYLVRTGVSY